MNLKRKNLDYVLIIFVIIHFASATILNNRYLPFSLGITLFILHAFSNKLFSLNFLYLVFVWILGNFVSMFYFGTEILLFRLAIITVNLLLFPYLLISYIGEEFWKKFEAVIYFLTRISLPLYLLNVVFSSLFNNMQSIFKSITISSFLVNPNYWSAGIYVNAIADSGYGINRNNGFMWEPGAFAMIIIWAMIYNWSSNETKLNKKFWVYFIALITTFSTAGYLAFVFVISAFYIKRVRFGNILLIGLTVFLFLNYVYQLDFLSAKIDRYFDEYEDNNINYHQLVENDTKELKVNRFQGAEHSLMRTFQYPIGRGIVSETDFMEFTIYGTNGLGSFLEMWGVAGFIFLLVMLWKYLKFIQKHDLGKISRLLFLLALLIVFFSNPIQRNMFLYLLFMFPMTYSVRTIYKY